MKISLYILIIMVLGLSACQENDKHRPGERSRKEIRDSIYRSLPRQTINGIYFYGKDKSELRLCSDSTKKYYVFDNTGKIDSIYMALLPFQYPYEPLSVRFKGVVKPHPKFGPASEYDSVMEVESIQKAISVTYEDSCYAYDFFGLNMNPEWMLVISGKYQIIVLKDYATRKIYQMRYVHGELRPDKSVHFDTRLENADVPVLIHFSRVETKDTSSGKIFHYNCTFKISDKAYSGVGIKFGELPYANEAEDEADDAKKAAEKKRVKRR